MVEKGFSNDKKTTAVNTFFLYLLAISKIIFPLVTLPYLTRVLSTDCYGVVSYVKSYIVYAQLIVDFGFILSSVKDIVNANGDKEKIGLIAGQTFLAKVILAGLALIVTLIVSFTLPILRDYFWYTILSYFVVLLSCFLADFLFRGVEKMHYVSIVFVSMKAISTILTLVFVKNDSDIMLIPIMDIVSSIVAILITYLIIICKLKIKIRIKSFRGSFLLIKDSFFYFISNMATTAFGALNTLLIGIFITDLTQIAYWTVCNTVVSAVQSLYTPIINGVYPYMLKHRSLSYIHKVLMLVMPILLVGAIVGFFLSKTVLQILGGDNYSEAYWLLRSLIPLMIISFPAMLYGWPTLGSIGKIKQTSFTTLISAVCQIVGLVMLILIDRFTLINLAFLRMITELILFGSRAFIAYKNKAMFVENQKIAKEGI